MSRIIVTVSGGIAEVNQSTIPKGIEVVIRDYRIDGDKKDDNGNSYVEFIWSRVA